MTDIVENILKADENEIEMLLKAVLQRYSELFPDWEMNTFSISKTEDREEQIDECIALLTSMKSSL